MRSFIHRSFLLVSLPILAAACGDAGPSPEPSSDPVATSRQALGNQGVACTALDRLSFNVVPGNSSTMIHRWVPSWQTHDALLQGYTLEHQGDLYLYADAGPGGRRRPYYQCYAHQPSPSNPGYTADFYTMTINPGTEPTCNGPNGHNLGVVGWVEPTNVAGSVPMYREQNPTTGENYYTLNDAKKAQIEQAYGFTQASAGQDPVMYGCGQYVRPQYDAWTDSVKFAFPDGTTGFSGVNMSGLPHYGLVPGVNQTYNGCSDPASHNSLVCGTIENFAVIASGRTDIRANLNYAVRAGAKVVRVNAAGLERYNNPSVADVWYQLWRLKNVLDWAQLRGLYVDVVLTDSFKSEFRVPGDDPFYSVPIQLPSGQTFQLGPDWYAWGYQQNYLPYIDVLVDNLKNHPALFAWEIVGEPRAFNTNNPNNGLNPSLLASFLATMSAHIRSKDPNHMITTGLESAATAALRGTRDAGGTDLGLKVYQDPNIDFVTTHNYNGISATGGDHDDGDFARATGKPYAIGEANFTRSPGVLRGPETLQDALTRQAHDQISGYTLWAVSDASQTTSEMDGALGDDHACSGCQADFDSLTEAIHDIGAALSSGSGPFVAASFKDMSNVYRGGDWDFCYDKVTCPPGDRVVGMSQMNGAGRRVLCRHAASGAYTGNVTATLVLPASGDNRRTTARGDWAPGYQKLECGQGEYVSAASEGAPVCEGPGNYRFHAVQCSQGQNLGETCRERVFDAGDSRATNMLDTGDWDVGAYKGECGPNTHVAGVSVSPSTGAPHSLLCCSVDP